MKTVTLLRHAKSDWGDMTLRDFDRPLNARGERAARLMGGWAKRQDLHFDRVIASPAARVVDTLNHFTASFGPVPEPVWDGRVYLASAATLADVVAETADGDASILLVGHNPGLEDLILDLVADDGLSSLRDDVAEKFPTAAMAVLDFDVPLWRALGNPPAHAGTIRRFVRPRDLDKSLGPERG